METLRNVRLCTHVYRSFLLCKGVVFVHFGVRDSGCKRRKLNDGIGCHGFRMEELPDKQTADTIRF